MKVRFTIHSLSLTLFSLVFGCHKEPVEPDPEPIIHYPEAIVAGNTAGRGINYVDITDTTIPFNYPSSQGEIELDLNGDQIADFKMVHVGSASPGHSISGSRLIPFNQNALAVSTQQNEWVDTLSVGTTISSGLEWVSDTCILYSFANYYQGGSSSSGLWNNAMDQYAGTRIDLGGGNYLYGWIRCTITSGWNPTVFEYATTVGYLE